MWFANKRGEVYKKMTHTGDGLFLQDVREKQKISVTTCFFLNHECLTSTKNAGASLRRARLNMHRISPFVHLDINFFLTMVHWRHVTARHCYVRIVLKLPFNFARYTFFREDICNVLGLSNIFGIMIFLSYVKLDIKCCTPKKICRMQCNEV